MIAAFVGITPSPTRDAIRVCFVDQDEMSWFVEVPLPLTVEKMDNLLRSMLLLSSDPMSAIRLGVLTQEDYESALAARDEHRAMRAADPVQKVH